MKTIQLTQGQFALIDDEDEALVSSFNWCASRIKVKWYAMASVKGKTTYLHRMIMKPEKGLQIDHINGNSLDCRRSNMRVCTARENARNRRMYTFQKTSKYLGVHRRKKDGKWLAVAVKPLKAFSSEVEAAKYRDAYVKKEYGEFAVLNFNQ